MTDTRTEHTPGNDTRLWCLHHIGADDIHAAPDFETAQAWANWANGQFAEHADISRFVVAVWPWSADDHAEHLPRSTAEWTVPAASLPAVSEGEPNSDLECAAQLERSGLITREKYSHICENIRARDRMREAMA